MANDHARQPIRLKLTADHHQLHLLDDGRTAVLADAWTVQATEDRLAVTDGAVGIGTGSNGIVPVEIHVLPGAPPVTAADHITEASLEVRSGRLVALGCTEFLPDARRIELTPGPYRLRITHTGLDRKERIAVHLWPATAAPPAVLTRWTPPPRTPRRGKAEVVRTSKQAVAAARAGRCELAVPVLTKLADQGRADAAASLAEILAFRGEWHAFVPRAEALLENPEAVYAGNVFTDMARLFRRAARELRAPEILARAAARVPPRYHAMRDATLLLDVVVPSERLAEVTTDQRAAFAAAAQAAASGKRFAGKPAELAAHQFALASAYNMEEEIHRLWNQGLGAPRFESALVVARWHAFRGRAEAAWQVIAANVTGWFPVDAAQVAPVVLLVDPLLSPLLTPERCAWVLQTPRGCPPG